MKFACFYFNIFFHGFLFCQNNSEYIGQPQNNLKVEQLQLKKQELIKFYDSMLSIELLNSSVAKSELQELKKSKNVNKDMMSSFNVDDVKFNYYQLLQKEKIINPESVNYNSYLSNLNKTFVSASEILLITHNGFFCGFVDSLGQIIDCTKILFSKEQQQKFNKLILNGKLAFIRSNQELLERFTGVSTGYLFLKNEYEKLDNEIIAKVSQLNRIEISIDELNKKREKELIKLDNEIDLILMPRTTTQSTNYFGSGGSGNGSGNGPFGGSGNGNGIGSGNGSGKGRVRLNSVSLPSYENDFECRIGFMLQINSEGQVIGVRTIRSLTTCVDDRTISDIKERIKREVRYNKDPGAGIIEMNYTFNLKPGVYIEPKLPILKEITSYDIDNSCSIQFDLQVDSTGSIIQISVNKEKTTCKGESIIADLSERIQDEVKFSKHTNDSTIEETYFVTLLGREIKELKKIGDSLIEELKQLRHYKEILDSMVSSWQMNEETYKNYQHHRNKIFIDPASDYYKKFLKKLGCNTKSLVEVLPDSAYIRIYKPIKHHSYSEFQEESYQLSEYESMILSKSKMQGTIKVLENNDVVLQEIIGISEFNFNTFNDKEITSWAILAKNVELERTQKYIAILENKSNQLTTLKDTIFEEDAEFPGGVEELNSLIRSRLNYPDEAYDIAINSRVVVRFVVEKDGCISNASVERPIAECPACNQEALIFVNQMPNWVPATNSGHPVRLWVRLPIIFNLQ